MLLLLAILCPPLAVLATGNSSRAVANLGLTMLLFVPGVVHALSAVGQTRLERRYQSVMRAMACRPV